MTPDDLVAQRATVSNQIGGSAQISGVTVLAGSVTGGIHHHRATPAPQIPVPRQLPRVPAHFTDRVHEVAALDAARAAGATLVVVSGIGGVGKSALATRWLERHDFYRGGHLYADLKRYAAPEPILQQWLRALGLERPPADLQELTGLWRSFTASRVVAVELDNATTAEQVRPLLPAGTRSMTVVTSRTSLWDLAVDGAVLHRLGPLGRPAALDLLARLAGAERVAAEPDAAERLAAVCAYHPLPLVLAGARLATRPERGIAAVAEALARSTTTHSNHEDSARMAITAGLEANYDGLEENAKRVYRRLGLLPIEDIDPEMIAVICRVAWGDAEWLLEVLADEQLLEPLAPDRARPVRYRLSTPGREHAELLAERTDDEASRGRALRRLAEWMLATAAQAQLRLTPAQATLQQQDAPPPPDRVPFADDAGAMAWLESHEKNVLGVLRTAQNRGWDDIVWRLVDAYWPFFLRRHPYALWIEAHDIALASAQRTGNQAAVRQMLNSGAIGLSSAGRLDQAITWYTSALETARAGSDLRDEGQALLGLGACHYEAARPRQAEPYLHEAIALWDGCGYPRGVALATIVLGEIALTADDPQRAQGLFANARCTLLAAEDSYDAARALALYGRARALAGDPATGIGEMKAAAGVFEAAGSTRWLARVLEMLGTTHQEGGDSEAARPYYQRAAELMAPIRPADAERIERLEQAL